MYITVLNMFHQNQIAAIALLTHTGDKLQPLDVSVFGTQNHFANEAVLKITAIKVRLHFN